MSVSAFMNKKVEAGDDFGWNQESSLDNNGFCFNYCEILRLSFSNLLHRERLTLAAINPLTVELIDPEIRKIIFLHKTDPTRLLGQKSRYKVILKPVIRKFSRFFRIDSVHSVDDFLSALTIFLPRLLFDDPFQPSVNCTVDD